MSVDFIIAVTQTKLVGQTASAQKLTLSVLWLLILQRTIVWLVLVVAALVLGTVVGLLVAVAVVVLET